jgi:HSP20 family protein
MVTQSVEQKEKDKGQIGSRQAKGQTGEGTMARSKSDVVPFGGFDPLHRFRDEFTRLFDQFIPAWSGSFDAARRNNWGFDVREENGMVTVRAEAPGFEPNEFDIEVRDNQLIMCACHKSEGEEKESGAHEWQRREFYHSMTLPAGVDPNKVDAEYHHGILSVKFPKTEESKGRHIPVKG